MDILAVELCFLVFFVAHIIQADLKRGGEHVCLKTETYKETIFVEVQVTEHESKGWCSIKKIFHRSHRCKVKKTVKEPRVVNRTRIVLECCAGYEKDATNSECVPVCRNQCIHGQCTAPDTCSCDSGFHGNTCGQTCPAGRWGRNCNENCDCRNGGKCERVFGKCTCQPGWQGYKCESSCPEGYYGHSCTKRCNCNGLSCNAVSGACPPTTISTTTTTSTTTSTTPSTTPATEQTTTEMTFTITSTPGTTAMETPATSSTTDSSTEEVTHKTAQITLTNETLASVSSIAMQKSESVSPKTIEEAETETTKVTEKEANLKKKSYSDVDNEILMVLNESETSTDDEFVGRTSEMDVVFVENEIDPTNRYTGIWNTDLSVFRFLPSLTVLSGTFVLLFIIAARWLFVRHQKTMRKIAEGKIGHQEQRIKPPKSILTVNSIACNPVYVSDVELISATPVLKTFRPLKAETTSKNMDQSLMSSQEGSPPSNTHNEDQHNGVIFHIYEEIPIKVDSKFSRY